MTLVFVTSSPEKHREAEAILGLPLERVALSLREVQSLCLREVAEDKARQAYGLLQRPVLVEDTALELAALGGFPGPLIKWLLHAASPAALPHMLQGFGNFQATARCVACFFDGQRLLLGEGVVAGTIVPLRGTGGFGWDRVFVPRGESRTYAEMSWEEKNRISHRAQAFQAMAEKLLGERVSLRGGKGAPRA